MRCAGKLPTLDTGECLIMARLSNSKLRQRALRGCRVRIDDTAGARVQAARESGDRRMLGRLRRAMGA